MMQRYLRLTAFFIVFCSAISTACAQVGGATGGVDTGDIGGTTGAGGELDADVVFDQVDRGAGIGSTGATGQGFSEASAATGTGGGGLGGLGGFGGLGGGLGGLGNLFGGLGGAGSQTTQPVIRTRLRSAISVLPTPPAVVQQVATTRFRSLSSRPEMRGINVQMDGRTAVLSGLVPTASDRRMSEMLMRLEPGVSRVQNQISVAQ